MLKLLAGVLLSVTPLGIFGSMPSTTNYSLQSYGFGSGGTANSGTSNYSLEGITGELSGQSATTTNYQAKPGYTETQQANVPKITLANPSNYYDKLHFVIDNQSNPSDALFAMQISTTSNFSSNINYVQNDNTIGPSLTTVDYQTYLAWGGGSGGNIIGLSAGTTYYIRAKATQGKFTESAYGPSSSAATVSQQISFCVYTNSCGAVNSTSFSGLLANTVSTSGPNIQVTFSTNADNGGNVYIYSKNGALQSTTIPSGTISSVPTGLTPTNLSSATSGYGAQVSAGAVALTAQAPYSGTSNNVGSLTGTINPILSSTVPVTGGSATINLQAKPSSTTPAASDYSDIVTVIAAANF